MTKKQSAITKESLQPTLHFVRLESIMCRKPFFTFFMIDYNILYTTVNSNLVSVDVLGYLPPVWQICLFVADGLIVLMILIWNIKAGKKVKQAKAQEKEQTAKQAKK